jgi:hypothetical protein
LKELEDDIMSGFHLLFDQASAVGATRGPIARIEVILPSKGNEASFQLGPVKKTLYVKCASLLVGRNMSWY